MLKCHVLCQCKKKRAIQPQSNKKRTLQPKTRHQKQRQPEAIFVKEAKIENAAHAVTIFVKNIRKLFACNAITNGLKVIVPVAVF